MPAPNSIRKWLSRRRPGAEAQAVSRFKRNGCRPGSPGCTDNKWAALGTALARPDFPAAAGSPGFGYCLDERLVELSWLFSRIPAGRVKRRSRRLERPGRLYSCPGGKP